VNFKPLQLNNFKTSNFPALAVSITASSYLEICKQIIQADKSRADVIEWRLDYFLAQRKSLSKTLTLSDFKKIRGLTEKPLILTWRTTSQGGRMPFDLRLYSCFYQWAVFANFAAVDVEFQLFKKITKLINSLDGKIAIICSWHDFQKLPSNFLTLGEKMSQSQAQILKIAVTPHSKAEVIKLLIQTRELNSHIQQPLISIGMGDVGQISRIIGFKFGSSLTFSQLNMSSAPGQLPLQKLQDELFKVIAISPQVLLDRLL